MYFDGSILVHVNMIILFYRSTLLFIFLVKMTVSSKYFKHYRLAAHKVNHQVYPSDTIDGNYTVYIAGKVFSIKVPASVEADPYKIVNWKVLNSNPNRLMYISDGSAYIMIDQKTKKKLVFPNENIGSIIVLGNNEAIHMPTIENPNLYKPNIVWNYFELLYFDEEKETIKIIESIPWLEQDDWEFIAEWKMLDHLTIETKMYILAKRKFKSLLGSDYVNVNELFITRLSLDVDKKFLDSAVECKSTFPFQDIYQAQFLLLTHPNQMVPFSILVSASYEPGYGVTMHAILPKFEACFDAVTIACQTTNFCLQMHFHLRSGVAVCYQYDSCSIDEKLYPTGTFDYGAHPYYQIPLNATLRSYNAGYEDVNYNLVYSSVNQLFSCVVSYTITPYCNRQFGGSDFTHDSILNVVSGQTISLVDSISVTVTLFTAHYPCSNYVVCANCIVYGFKLGCIWSDGFCKQREFTQVFNYREYTVNHCFTISSFSLDYLREENILTIIFQENELRPIHRFEQVSVFAGPNNDCVNIKIGYKNLTCELNLRTPGNFTLNVTFHNDAYLDTTPITAISSEKIVIVIENSLITVAILSFGIVVVAIFVICLVVINISSDQPTILPRLGETTKTFRSRISDYLGSTLDSADASFKSKTFTDLTFDRIRKKKFKATKK